MALENLTYSQEPKGNGEKIDKDTLIEIGKKFDLPELSGSDLVRFPTTSTTPTSGRGDIEGKGND